MALKEIKSMENSMVELTIEVDAQRFEDAIERTFQKDRKNFHVSGFRKGKATRTVIENLYGKECFFEGAINFLVPQEYDAVVNDSDINPVGQPNIDIKEATRESGLIFTAQVPVYPKIKLSLYKGIEAEYEEFEVLDDDINKELDKLSERVSRTESVDHGAENDDVAVIDFVGYIDGAKFEGGEGSDVNLVLGSGQFIPGFEAQLVGAKAGEQKDVVVTFPDDYNVQDLRGKEATFKCTVKEVLQKLKPVIDDEFAKDVSDFETLDELKVDLRAKLTERREAEAESVYKEKILDAVTEAMEADIPEIMYETQLDRIVEDFGYRMQGQGLPFESYLKMSGLDMDGFRKLFYDQAQRQVKVRLCLEEIAKLENLEVEREEIDAEYEKMQKQFDMEIDRIKVSIPEEIIVQDLKVDAALKFLEKSSVMKKIKAAPKNDKE